MSTQEVSTSSSVASSPQPKNCAGEPTECDENEKKSLNLVVIGHVDAGKSTATGHLLVKCGGIDARTLAKFEKESQEIGKGSFKYAWALDKLSSERDRGITIDISHTTFSSPHRIFTIIDAPGHRDFIKNMITGTAQADAAMLIVSAAAGQFEVGFSKGGQTKEHALLAYSLGVRQLVVCCNKMDDPSVAYSEARYNEIRQEVLAFLGKLGFAPDAVPVIPISGWLGDNITERAEGTMPWYAGPTLIEALDVLQPPARLTDAPLRVPLQDVFKVAGIGTVAVGRVETGVLRPGAEIIVSPGNLRGQVGVIEHHNKPLTKALPGTHVGFSIKGLTIKDIRRGFVVGSADPTQDPPQEVAYFIAQIIVLGGGGADGEDADWSITPGYTPIVDCHTRHVACVFEALEARIDRRTGRVIEERPNALRPNDAGVVRLVPCKPTVLEAVDAYPPLGRFTVRDAKRTVAIGIVKHVVRKGAEGAATAASASAAASK